jgi:hypothetical protein
MELAVQVKRESGQNRRVPEVLSGTAVAQNQVTRARLATVAMHADLLICGAVNEAVFRPTPPPPRKLLSRLLVLYRFPLLLVV